MKRGLKILCIIICLLLFIGMIYFITAKKNKTACVNTTPQSTLSKEVEKERKNSQALEQQTALKHTQIQNQSKQNLASNESSNAVDKEDFKSKNQEARNESAKKEVTKIAQKPNLKDTKPSSEVKNEDKKSDEAKKVELQIKEILALNKIEFETSKSSLTPEGRETVAKIALILKEHPNIKIEIAGHTDSTGNAAMNQKLSEERAKKVKEALVAFGISPNRLVAKGYGESQPLKNMDKTDKANRRVEFIIIEE